MGRRARTLDGALACAYVVLCVCVWLLHAVCALPSIGTSSDGRPIIGIAAVVRASAINALAEVGSVVAVEDVNAGALGLLPHFQLHLQEHTITTVSELFAVTHACVSQGLIGIIYHGSSSHALRQAPVSAYTQLPFVNSGAKSPRLANSVSAGDDSFSWFFRVIPEYGSQCAALLEIMAHHDWKDIMVITGVSALELDKMQCFLTRAVEFGVRVVESYLHAGDTAVMEDKMRQARAKGIRLLFVSLIQTAEQGARGVSGFQDYFDVAIKLGMYGYPYQIISDDLWSDTSNQFEVGSHRWLRAHAEVEQGIIALSGRPASGATSDRLNRIVQERTNATNQWVQYAYDCVLVYAHALHALLEDEGVPLGDVTPTMLRNAMWGVEVDGASGRFRFSNGSGERQPAQYNIVNQQTVEQHEYFAPRPVVGYWSSSTGVHFTAPPVYAGGAAHLNASLSPPVKYYSCSRDAVMLDGRGVVAFDAPDSSPDILPASYKCDQVLDCDGWEDESFDCSPSLLVGNIVFSVVAGVLILVDMVLIVCVFVLRHDGRFRVSGLVFQLALCVSSAVGLSSMFAFVGKSTRASCSAGVMLLVYGHGALLGGFIAKEIRLFVTWFNAHNMRTVVVTPPMMVMCVVGVLVPDTLLLVLWFVLDAPFPETIDIDGSDHYFCRYNLIFIAFFLAYHFVLSVGVSAIAFITRRLPSFFGELVQVSLSVYTMTLLMCVFVPVLAVVNHFGRYVFGNVFVAAVFFSAVAINVLPKLWLRLARGPTTIDPSGCRPTSRPVTSPNSITEASPSMLPMHYDKDLSLRASVAT